MDDNEITAAAEGKVAAEGNLKEDSANKKSTIVAAAAEKVTPSKQDTKRLPEKIVGKRISHRYAHYQVKWTNDDTTTWEPRPDVRDPIYKEEAGPILTKLILQFERQEASKKNCTN